MRYLIGGVAIAALYLWFIGALSRDEIIAAGGCAIVVVALVSRVASELQPRPQIAWSGVAAILTRVPLATVRESFDILVPMLWRRLVRREPVCGRWIALRYNPDDGSDGYGRRALVIFGSGITPNAFPLEIDGKLGRLYLHQLVARREAAADHPEYPI